MAGLDVSRTDEGALLLNVDTPRADDGRRPVLVWIHGGSFASGSASLPLYDGCRLAVRRDVVVVGLQYRLGALGYLDLSRLGGAELDASPNLGQLDQIAGLRWVQENIAAFGGDPGNVTVFGASAGAMAIAVLLAMPAAAGLFHKAILQSGAAQQVLFPEVSEQVARDFLHELGLSPASLEALWEVPAEQLLAAQGRMIARHARRFLSFSPVVDGVTLPREPLASIAEGHGRDVPLLIGTNLDEMKFFRIGVSRPERMDPEELLERVRRRLPARSNQAAGSIVDCYRKAREERGASLVPRELIDAIDTDLAFRIPAIRLAEAHSQQQRHTYMYLWTWPSPALGGALGACHAVEIPFVFGTLDAPGMDQFSGSGPEAEWLSAQVMDAWVGFARKGRPRNVGWSDWPPYSETQRCTFEIGRVPRLLSSPLDAERIAWEGVL
jgi:para-nitrobenzyl esterase